MDETIYVVDGLGGEPDGGYIRTRYRLDGAITEWAVWFGTETAAQRYIDQQDPDRRFPFKVVATTQRQLKAQGFEVETKSYDSTEIS